MSTITERWHSIKQRIDKLQQESPLASRPVTLIAVAKAQPVDAILSLLAAGQQVFAENRVQEAAVKWPMLLERTPDISLHLIGGLQTNKVKEALSLFDAIHTVDRVSLVDALVKERDKGQRVRCKEFFIQVNTGEEPQKGGVFPADAQALLAYCRTRQSSIAGLMCVPPAGEPAAPHFALLGKMTRAFGLANLSMGMSQDYETAIRLGATHVRIGTALFGERR